MKKYGIYCFSTNTLCKVLYEFAKPHLYDVDGRFGTNDINEAYRCMEIYNIVFNFLGRKDPVIYMVIEK